MSNETIVVADENGVSREYRQVKRKANVGERILIVKASASGDYYKTGSILTVTDSAGRGGSTRAITAKDVAVGIMDYEYVVLEPTDIVVIDGARYKSVKRKAAKGDRVLITVNSGDYEVGRTFTLHEKAEPFSSGHVNYADGKYGMFPDQYIVLEKVEPVAPSTTIQPATPSAPSVPSTDELTTLISKLAADNVKLEKRVASLEANVTGHERSIGTMDVQLRVAREDIVLIEEGASDHIIAVEKRVSSLEERKTPSPSIVNNITVTGRISSEDVVRQITETLRKTTSGSTPKIVTSPSTVLAFNDRNPLPTLSRQDVINNAKADVTELETTQRKVDGNCIQFWPVVAGNNTYYTPMQKVEYVVNRDKRTVVAIIKYIGSFCGPDGSTIFAKGKCRCAPDDVFNVDIGKAISLRRALGLDVPADYLKSPQPTEPQVGDIVQAYAGRTAIEPLTVQKITREDGKFKMYRDIASDLYCSYDPKDGDHIIDDSRETAVSL